MTMDPLNAIADRDESIRVGMLLFPEVEILDFAGPFEVFSVASRLLAPSRPRPAFSIATVSASVEPVRARHGLIVTATHDFDAAPTFDLFVVPGGVMDAARTCERTVDYVRRTARSAQVLASVCTGVFLLADADLLGRRAVTTHWEDIDALRSEYPELPVLSGQPFVDHGNLITSAGISAGIGMCLHLVGRALGQAHARRTARQMEYDWQPASD